jgi:hypothetical protein
MIERHMNRIGDEDEEMQEEEITEENREMM